MKTLKSPVVHRRKTRFPPHTILVPLDFSECSNAGLAAAKHLAARFDCRLELAHVDEGPPPADSQGGPEAVLRFDYSAHEGSLRARLRAAQAGVGRSGTHLVSGLPSRVIGRLAADAAADLIVMGTHGRRGLRRWAFGSVAESAVHVCRAPVLVTRRAPSAGWPRRILAPYKWTSYGDAALRAAAAWARFLGAELGILHVSEGNGLSRVPHDELRAHVERFLELDAPGPRWLWRAGRPAQRIVETAAAEAFDLIVVAAHVRAGLHDALIGTTAERVIRTSPVPVLAVPSQAGR